MLNLNNLSEEFIAKNSDLIIELRRSKAAARQQGHENQKQGERVEVWVKHALEDLGFKQVSRIQTGWKVLWRNKKPINAWPIAKVAADFTAVLPGGQAVICEVKSRPDTLQWSALDNHQVENLNTYSSLGALSLLAWHNSNDDEIYVMKWPIFGRFFKTKPPSHFGSRMAIREDIAMENLYLVK